jgi:hypothetical protein
MVPQIVKRSEKYYNRRMSISPIIDSRYRLNPHDIGRQDRVVTIQNVSWQGLETLTPLLHLREFPTKRLALEKIQQQELWQITGSRRAEDWIGHTLLLAAQSDRDQLRIHLYPLQPSTARYTALSPTIRVPESWRATALLLLILLLLFLLVPLLDQSDLLWQWLGL